MPTHITGFNPVRNRPGHDKILLMTVEGEIAERSAGLSPAKRALLEKRLRGELGVSGAFRRQILVEWNATATDYPRNSTIAQIFEELAARTPLAPALVSGKASLSYGELNARANRLAHRLRSLGVGVDSLVAIYMERSAELIVALLGVLKAGGAYLGLDRSSPPKRIAFQLRDARPRVVIASRKLLSELPDPGCPVLWAEDHAETSASLSEANLMNEATAESLAYVSYTSGSTGEPKGVCIPNRGVVRLVKNTNFAHFGPDEVFLQLAPIAFDASTLEIWGPLLNGGKLVIFPPGQPTLSELGEFIRTNAITTLWLTAGLFHQMVDHELENLRGVRQLIAGGDSLSVPHAKRAVDVLKNCRLINGYGPSENTTFTCCHTVAAVAPEERSIPIGRPVANTRVYILDERMQPVPVGVAGELWTGGDGLARGYLNSPELTAEKFAPDPFAGDPGARLYRTGDMARYLSDGRIEFLGRSDRQVKIRGFRVELQEIESALAQSPAVRQCVVAAAAGDAEEKKLTAYVVSNAGSRQDAEGLKAFLQKLLPDYMVPADFVFLDELPLALNGKVDRRALPSAHPDAVVREKGRIPPRNDLEKRLARVWEDVLETKPVGATDVFFELGGHSLLAVRLLAQIEAVFDCKLPFSAIYQAPTVAQMALLLATHDSAAGSGSPLVDIQPRGTKPPLFLVHGVAGGMLWGYANMARHLGDDQPVHAFKSRGSSGLAEFVTIEEMAAHYVSALRQFQPRGPYCLGGYCFGGNVAFEMARQLSEQGERVEMLALFNASPPNSRFTRMTWSPLRLGRFLYNLFLWLGEFRTWDPGVRRQFLRWKTRKLTSLFMKAEAAPERRNPDAVVDLCAFPDDQRGLLADHVRSLIHYQSRPYPGRVTLFRTRGYPLFCSFDPAYGWGEFATGGVTVKIIPGAHDSILEEPYVQVVAREIKTCLEEAARHGRQ